MTRKTFVCCVLHSQREELELRSASPLEPPYYYDESESLTKYGNRSRSSSSGQTRNLDEPVQCSSPTRRGSLKDGVVLEPTALSYDNFIPGGAKAVSTPEEMDPGAFNIVRDDGKLTSSVDHSADDISTRPSAHD